MSKKIIVSIWLVLTLVMIMPFQYVNADGNKKKTEMSDEEYATWKEEYVSQSSNDSGKRKSSVSNSILSNEYIGVSLASNGRFTIGTTGGNPNISTDDNKKLLYGYPGGTTSYTTVRINGVSHIFDNDTGEFDETQNNHTSLHVYSDIKVEQSLTIVEGDSREDLVEIKYTVENTSEVSQNVGLRIMLDTMLGDNDRAPFRVAGYGNITTETEFTGDDIPFYWQAFDSLTNPKVTSMGQFWSDNGNNPDVVQFTNWGNVYNTDWNYKITGNSNGDSAVSVIWNEDNLRPSEIREYVTYYGLSELSEDLTPPIALGVYADSNVSFNGENYNPSEITVSSYIKNIGGAIADNVKVSIILPEDLKLSSGYEKEKTYQTLGINEEKEQYFKIFINTRNPKNEYTIQVKVEADNCAPKVVSRKIKIQDSKKAIIVVPGMMGSNLIDSTTNELVWFDTSWLQVEGLANAVTGKFKCNDDGSSANPNIVAKSGNQEYGTKDVYKDLITTLKRDYEPYGYDVVFAPYDWRMPLESGASTLYNVIKNYDEVSIVAHSMGGLVVEKYIDTRGTNKIKKVVTAGTPYWGAPMAADTLYSGNIMAFPDMVNVFTSNIMRPIVHNFTGVHELLPNQHYTEEVNWWTQWSDSYDNFWNYIVGPSMDSDLYDWNETKGAYNKWFNNTLVAIALNDQNQLKQNATSSPMDRVDCTMIVGNGVSTEISAGFFFNSSVDNYAKLVAANMSLEGDGTVPLVSATMNRLNTNQGNNIEKIDGVNHLGLVQDGKAITKITSALNKALGIESENTSQYTLYNTKSYSNETSEGNEYYSIYLVGDIDFDVYLNNELCYYLHHRGDGFQDVKQGNEFVIRDAGIYDNMPVMMIYFKNANYKIDIHSNQEQKINFVLDTNTIDYALEKYEIGNDETLEISLLDGEPEIIRSGNLIDPIVIIDGVVQEQNQTTIYFVDNTQEGWIANDSSVIELVDNTFGHERYIMTTEDNKVWSVKVPTSAYNITFNRYNQDKSILWNSWSAGGRDGKVTYVAEGNSNGHWTE